MTTAIYAASFDPITKGHRSIYMQGLKMFSHVRLLLAVHPDKKCLLNSPSRLYLIEQEIKNIPNISVDYTDGLVVDYARSIGATYLLRGIRGESDVLYELKLAEENKKLAPEIQTVFLPAAPEVADVSSSKLKELIKQGQDVSKFCSKSVELSVRDKLDDLERWAKITGK